MKKVIKYILILIIGILLFIPNDIYAGPGTPTNSHSLTIDLPEIGEHPPYAVDDDYAEITSQEWKNTTDNKVLNASDIFEENKFYNYTVKYNIKLFNNYSDVDHFSNSPYSLGGGASSGNTTGQAGWDFYMGNKDNINVKTNDVIVDENTSIMLDGKLKKPSVTSNDDKVKLVKITWQDENDFNLSTDTNVEKGKIYKLRIYVTSIYGVNSNFQVINNNKGENENYQFINETTTVEYDNATYVATYKAKKSNISNITFHNTNNDYSYNLKVPLNMNVNLKLDELNCYEMYNEGHKLLGWNTKETGEGNFYSADATINANDDIDLYTVWSDELVKLNVSFKCNPTDTSCTGSPITYNKSYNPSETITTPGEDDFKKNEYKLLKWKKSTNNIYYFKINTEVQLQSIIEYPIYDYNIDYYAHFSNSYKTLTIHANNGTSDYTEIYFEPNDTVCLTTNNYSKKGYNFNGWSYTLDGSPSYSSTGSICQIFVDSFDLYLVWKPITYKLYFYNNGGSGSMSYQSMTYDEETPIKKNTFTKKGYKFIKWTTTINETPIEFTDEQVVKNLLSTNNAQITLYAQWEPIKYNIEFNSNTGNGTMDAQQFTYDTSQKLTPNTFTKKGYKFKKWTTEYGTNYADSSSIYNITTVDNETITLYAQWEPIYYYVRFNTNGGNGYYMIDQKVYYDQSTKLNKNNYSKQYHIFKEWNTDPNGEGTSYQDEEEILNLTDKSTTIDLYAIYERNEFEIKFNSNYGENTTSNQIVEKLVPTKLTKNIYTRENYEFEKWTTNPDGTGNSYTDEETVIISEDVLLYAQWKKVVPQKVSYTTHVQSIGWQEYVSDGEMAGTSGRSLRLEGIKIKIEYPDYNGSIEYRTQVQDYGWQNFVSNDIMAGTSGESKRLEAIEIRLTGELANHFDVYYRVHAQDVGWMSWAKNGERSGTEGYGRRLEGIEIVLVEKGQNPPERDNTRTNKKFVKKAVTYRTHVQDYGWQESVADGKMSGTSHESKRLEGIEINLYKPEAGNGIEYRTHVQSYGWMNWVSNGTMSGTSHESKRLEAIEIRLTGEVAETHDVYYRVHAENFGWMGWAKNGASAGTAHYAYRLEGIEIVVLEKGEEPPIRTDTRTPQAFIDKNAWL